MNTGDKSKLSLPETPGRLIIENSRFMIAKLLPTRKFADYAKARGLTINVDRLRRFERLSVFRPIVRFIDDERRTEKFQAPGSDAAAWFGRGHIVDTYDPETAPVEPSNNEEQSEAYYSIFQLDHLSRVLNAFTCNLQMDGYLRDDGPAVDWRKEGAQWQDFADAELRYWRQDTFWAAAALLCQYIADRYFPLTQTNQRVITVSGSGFSEDPWMFINGHDWDWHDYARAFDAKDVANHFGLTPDKLKNAYEIIGGSAGFCDPLDKWSELVEFVSLQKKKKLKGDALRALAYRDAANMIRFLHKDLYGEELRPTHEIFGMVINRFPELEVREDVRRHLEYLVNQYDLNPQPKLVLFVEGESEIVLISSIFKKLFGSHPGVSGIEIVNLKGVNNATGNWKNDRFRAIFRLVDYLHHHQTLTYLILDRENQAERLLKAAKATKSLHGQDRLAVPHDHIALWKVSLEFDNFSDTEIAKAMTELAEGHATFKTTDIKAVRNAPKLGQGLSALYENRTGYGLKKPALAERLANILTDPKSRRHPKNRPIVKLLSNVRLKAARNPLPIWEKSWRRNQTSSYLGGRVKPKKR